MPAKHRVLATVVAVIVYGAASCAQRTTPEAQPSATRVEVGHETKGFPGATEPFQVPLHDSLAALRQKPPGTQRFVVSLL